MEVLYEKLSVADYEYIYIIALLILGILLFKQFKCNYHESNDKEERQIKESIDAHESALLAIKRFKYEAIDFDILIIELYKLLSYTKDPLHKFILNLEQDNMKIDDINKLVRESYSLTKSMLKKDITK